MLKFRKKLILWEPVQLTLSRAMYFPTLAFPSHLTEFRSFYKQVINQSKISNIVRPYICYDNINNKNG